MLAVPQYKFVPKAAAVGGKRSLRVEGLDSFPARRSCDVLTLRS